MLACSPHCTQTSPSFRVLNSSLLSLTRQSGPRLCCEHCSPQNPRTFVFQTTFPQNRHCAIGLLLESVMLKRLAHPVLHLKSVRQALNRKNSGTSLGIPAPNLCELERAQDRLTYPANRCEYPVSSRAARGQILWRHSHTRSARPYLKGRYADQSTRPSARSSKPPPRRPALRELSKPIGRRSFS